MARAVRSASYTRCVGINGKAVVRVIIEGEWLWVERGTFQVIPMEFVDDQDEVMCPTPQMVPAYYFTSTQGDPYYGPLSSISLFKLDNQILEETGTERPDSRGRPAALPEGSGETFGGDLGPRAALDDEAPATPTVALFADDIDEDDGFDAAEAEAAGTPEVDEEQPPAEDDLFKSGERRRGGLF